MTNEAWLLLGGVSLVAAWVVALLVFGGVTGWRRLARRYPAQAEVGGKRIFTGWSWLRWMGYRNLIWVCAGETHLHFRLWLRLGHPPFSVPWSDITAHRLPPVLGQSMVRFSFAGMPEVPFRTYGTVAERIVAASRGRIHLIDR